MTRLVYDQLGKPIPVLSFRQGTRQTVAFTALSTQSTSFAKQTRAVRLVATTACYYAVGANPTATATDNYLPADMVEYVGVSGEDKIAAVRVTTDGTLHIAEAD